MQQRQLSFINHFITINTRNIERVISGKRDEAQLNNANDRLVRAEESRIPSLTLFDRDDSRRGGCNSGKWAYPNLAF